MLESLINICASGHWIPFANPLSSEPHCSSCPSGLTMKIRIHSPHLLHLCRIPSGPPPANLVTTTTGHMLTKPFPYRSPRLIPFESLR